MSSLDPRSVPGRVRQELSNARFIGEMVVTRGVREVRRRLAEAAEANRAPAAPKVAVVGSDRPGAGATSRPDPARAERADTAAAEPTEPADPVEARSDAPTGGTGPAPAPDAGALALPDYDTLPAIDIVGQLADLTPEERAEVARYEQANRRRRTVLGKIAQLDGDDLG